MVSPWFTVGTVAVFDDSFRDARPLLTVPVPSAVVPRLNVTTWPSRFANPLTVIDRHELTVVVLVTVFVTVMTLLSACPLALACEPAPLSDASVSASVTVFVETLLVDFPPGALAST